jgi:hypothetical protein
VYILRGASTGSVHLYNKFDIRHVPLFECRPIVLARNP